LPPEFREWVIEFGHGAYVALYRYDGKQVVILAVRHDAKPDIELNPSKGSAKGLPGSAARTEIRYRP